jgi:hypothetical protein
MRKHVAGFERVVRAPTSWRRVVLAVIAAVATELAFQEPAWPSLFEPAESAQSQVLAPLRAGRPKARTPDEPAQSALDRAIRAQRLCVAAEGWSAGTLGSVVLYRSERVRDRVRVGYFVYWSSERPWGNNELTLLVLPALAVDAVYSHFLFVFPGLQRGLYGPGDIEGALVEYEEGDSGELLPVRAFADDATHQPVVLSRQDIAGDEGEVVLMTEAWSHQLGSRNAARRAPHGHSLRCFDGNALAPMSKEVASAFRLGSEAKPLRARPAWSTPSE